MFSSHLTLAQPVTCSQCSVDPWSSYGAAWASELSCTSMMASGFFRSAENASKLGPIMKAHLQPEGFLVNHKKSNWDPTPSLSRLRFSYDAVSRVISVHEGKLDKFVNERNRILGQKAVSQRQIAPLAGQLLAMQKALGPEARLKSRYLFYGLKIAC